MTIAPRQSDFSGQYDALPHTALGQRFTDDFLRPAESVPRRGIDQVDAAIDGRADSSYRFSLIGAAPHPAPHHPGSEADSGNVDIDIGNFSELHFFLLPFCKRLDWLQFRNRSWSLIGLRRRYWL